MTSDRVHWLHLSGLAVFLAACSPHALPPTPANGGGAATRSIVFVGCNRVDLGDVDPLANPSSANLAQLRRTFADIAALDPRPSHFFFCGDLVANMAHDDGQVVRGQLDGWMDEFRRSPLAGSGTVLVPLPGNHEVLWEDRRTHVESVNPAAYPVWERWLRRNGFDRYAGNGPDATGANPDHLKSDNRTLTYSFDLGRIHIIVVNTDTLTDLDPPPIGWIPLDWIRNDLAAADASPDIDLVFAFGHKPIELSNVPSDQARDGGRRILDSREHALASRLLEQLERSPKFAGYFCAHLHQWDARTIGSGQDVWQVIAGNGGSVVETDWENPYYGFTVMTVHEGGGVEATSYGRPVPDPYDALAPAPAATPRKTVILR